MVYKRLTFLDIFSLSSYMQASCDICSSFRRIWMHETGSYPHPVDGYVDDVTKRQPSYSKRGSFVGILANNEFDLPTWNSEHMRSEIRFLQSSSGFATSAKPQPSTHLQVVSHLRSKKAPDTRI